MTFLEPIRLTVGVSALGVVGLTYLLLRRRDHIGQAVWFPNQALYEEVVKKPKGWVRYVQTTLIGLSAVAIVVAAGNPALLERVPRQEAFIAVQIDASDSMLNDDIEPNRLSGALEGTLHFLSQVPTEGDIQISVDAYNAQVTEIVPLTSDYQLISDQLSEIQAGPGTAIGDALQTANNRLKPLVADTPEGEPVPAAILLLSDGASTTGGSVAGSLVELRQSRIPVHAIGYAASEEEASQDQLQEIAAATGGKYLPADSSQELSVVFEQLAQTSAYETIFNSIADIVAVAAGAMLFLYAAVTAVLRPRVTKENHDNHGRRSRLGSKSPARDRQDHRWPGEGNSRSAGLRAVGRPPSA